MTTQRAAQGMRSVEYRGAPNGSAFARRQPRLDDRHWLLIGAIVFGLEIVLAVALLGAVV